jgi:5-(carboxyamino)imidazole ribonucleotide mutase
MAKPVVAIIMGSDSDLKVMNEAAYILAEFNVPFEIKILSAHRTPADTIRYAAAAETNGIKVIIAGAGGAAHLAGVVAAHTLLPVIGVPMETQHLKGIDSLFSTVQMPAGVPVACMAIGGAKNAALMALQILGINNNRVFKKLAVYRKKLAESVRKKNRR